MSSALLPRCVFRSAEKESFLRLAYQSTSQRSLHLSEESPRNSHRIGTSNRSILNRSSSSSFDIPGPRLFSTSARTFRNTPARRPRDPLATASNAVRHQLPTGETFIVRPPPSTTSPFNLISNQTTITNPSTSKELPPLLKPNSASRSGIVERSLSEAQIAKIQSLRRENPVLHTASRLAKQFNVSALHIRIVAPLPADVRKAKDYKVDVQQANWGAKKTLHRELRKERKSLW